MKKPVRFVVTIFLTALLIVVSPLFSIAAQRFGHYQYSDSGSATVVVGDYYGRSERLHPDAASAYKQMVSAALANNVRLGIVSGFRNSSDQAGLWQRQVSRQGSESAAARWSAPPGHSEHHTGFALDIRDLDQPQSDLKTSFESTRAFQWLQSNANSYGFELSFPVGNSQGVNYEPWHWRFVGSAASAQVFQQAKGTTSSQLATQSVVTDVPETVPEEPNVTDQSFSEFKLEDGGSAQVSDEYLATVQDVEPDSSTEYKWGKGDSLSEVLTLGDIAHLRPEELTLKDIAAKNGSGEDPDSKSLEKSVHLVGVQTIGQLSEAIPGLPDMPVKALQPVADLVERAGRAYVKAWLTKNADAKLSKLLKVDPTLKDAKVTDLAMQNFLIGDIPGLSETPIGNFPGWQSAKIASVPGLDKLPMKDFPGGLDLNDVSVVGIVDVVYGASESQSSYKPISGSDVEGYKVPCLQESCAYLELRDPGGEEAPLHQARWIKGGQAENGGQMVKGGSGILGAAFGGKEPTGRNPFGGEANMKLVVSSVDEAEGTAKLSIYTRVTKKGLGATPYIFGPIPFMTVREGSKIPVGIDGGSSFTAPSLDIPEEIQKQIDQVSAKYDSPQIDSSSDSPCVDEAIKVTGSGYSTFAQKYIPLILKEAEKAELSENQTAYVLATARHESGMGKFMELMGDREPWGKYYARGFVGLTHDFNYQKWSKLLGMDLMANPDLAAQPEISARILVQGMKNGEFTGYKLSDFINGSQVNFYDARAIINGVKDSAQMYGNTASQYQKALKACSGFVGSCDGSGKMVAPVSGYSLSGFGWRIHPVLGIRKFHSGDDIPAATGTPIVAADCGKVIFADWEGGYGNSVVIEHKGKMFTRYAHQSSMAVKTGQTVGKGQKIGEVGSTGRSTGPHLHFEVRKGDMYGEPQNPKNYI